MPYIHVKITEGATTEQKAELVEGITDLMVKILDKNPTSTHVVIEEVSIRNWGLAGRTVKELREEGAPGISKK